MSMRESKDGTEALDVGQVNGRIIKAFAEARGYRQAVRVEGLN